MVVVGDAATRNEKEAKTKYPVEVGLTAGTTRQTGKKFLHPTEGSNVSAQDWTGT